MTGLLNPTNLLLVVIGHVIELVLVLGDNLHISPMSHSPSVHPGTFSSSFILTSLGSTYSCTMLGSDIENCLLSGGSLTPPFPSPPPLPPAPEEGRDPVRLVGLTKIQGGRKYWCTCSWACSHQPLRPSSSWSRAGTSSPRTWGESLTGASKLEINNRLSVRRNSIENCYY